jgi:hypothetical protein
VPAGIVASRQCFAASDLISVVPDSRDYDGYSMVAAGPDKRHCLGRQRASSGLEVGQLWKTNEWISAG